LFEPADALMTGVVQNQDAYMRGRIGQRAFYQHLSENVRVAMHQWTDLTGRPYSLIDPYRCEDAETVLVAMGSIADTAIAVVDVLRARGRRVGCVGVTSFRPFPSARIAAALRGARAVAIVERTDEPAAADNPLTREVKAALVDVAADGLPIPAVHSMSAGLGSRDVTGGDLAAVFDRLDIDLPPGQRYAVLGVKHSLGIEATDLEIRAKGAYSLRGHSIGGFGAVTTNKLLATLVGDIFDLKVQAYPRYGSEKKGLPTTYYLTIAEERIRTYAELERVEFVPLYDLAAFDQGNPLRGLVDGGVVFVSTPISLPSAIWAAIPLRSRTEIAARGIRVLALDTAGLARLHAPRPELLVRMQGIALVGVFLRVSPFAERAGWDRDRLMVAAHQQLGRFFGKRGAAVVDANLEVIRAAYDGVIDVTAAIQQERVLEPV